MFLTYLLPRIGEKRWRC